MPNAKPNTPKANETERFVEMVLDSPVDQLSRDHDRPRYFLGFRGQTPR